ncbi:MAG TPA: S8 family serine peptidase, partial [Umezawaea sp.]|nr:S8 family serine peptidase [Umezawaea sp.]
MLDTGVDATHPDLVGRELVEQNFTEDADNQDLVGHGTHVAATIASAGAKYRGVAPDAKILDGKVCIRFGCAESWILNGMAWAVEQGADVVNLSLGGGDTPEIDPLEEAVNTLSSRYGTLFVIAAGNEGSAETIGSPGSADAALTVGAVDRNDNIAPFSSRGPRVGDGGVKPDVTAPGVDIVAAKSSTGVIGTPAGDGYVSLSGTSMATPHVAGAAALLKQQHPDWNGSRIKAALVASAKPNPALTAFDQGTGRIDLTKAITQTVTAEPANLSLGLQQWPHADDVPVTKDVVYRNSGTDTVTLDVTVDAKGPDGKPAPAGLLTVSPANVTVPAGGEAKVVVTGDTRIGSVDGAFTGTVIATSTGGAVRSPISIAREVESYTVTVNHTDLDGNPSPTGETFLGDIGGAKSFYLAEADGSAQIRVPKGDYYTWSTVSTGKVYAFLAAPKLTVDKDTVVDADARTAKPVKVSVPEPAAVVQLSNVGATWPTSTGTINHSKALPDTYEPRTAQIGEDSAPNRMASQIGVQWQGTPVGDVPVNYRFASAWRGEMPTGVVRDLGKADFAEVRTTVGPSPEGRDHVLTLSPADSLGGVGFAWRAPVGASGTVTDHVAGDGVKWTSTHEQLFENTIEAEQNTPPREFRAGRHYDNLPGYAVVGPAMGGFAYALGRTDSTLRITVPMFGDSTGGAGYSTFDSARTTLFRDGEKFVESTDAGNLRADVPPSAASYRLETEATRGGVSEFSTKVGGTWTFRSADVGPRYTPIPMSIIRFRPALDQRNAAPANRLFPVPLVVQQNPDADNGRVNHITVDVSFDDGKTWRHAPVIGKSALIHNGPAGSFASLRAKTTDSKGNTADIT